MIDTKVFQEPMATQITALRIKARQKRRLTYDCLNAIVRNESVRCRKAHKLASVGNRHIPGMGLLSVLKGRSAQICQKCKDYNGEELE